MRKRQPCSFSGNLEKFKIAKKICRDMKININDYLNDAVDSLINNYGKEYKIAMLVRNRETINQELADLDKFKIPVDRIREINDGMELVKEAAIKYLKNACSRDIKGKNVWYSIDGASKAHQITFEQAKNIYLEVLPTIIQDPEKANFLYNEINQLQGMVKVG
jgi:predicted DNA-binding protein